MEPAAANAPLIAIIGETASGKSSIALQLAQRFSGEIIAADSRTVYEGMDIGTAKPTFAEQHVVPHHLINIITPDQPFSAVEYQQKAFRTIKEVQARGKLPILVGGTGLYVDAVLFNYKFPVKPPDQAGRERLRLLSVEELQDMLCNKGIALPANERNPRHLVRQLETGGVAAQKSELRPNTLVLGIGRDRADLTARITERVEAMFAQGLEAEVQKLVALYGWSYAPLQTIGYQEFAPYFAKEVTLEEVKHKIIRATVQYAKRQRTWFRRNKHVNYICNIDEAVDLVTTFLNK